MEPNSPEYLKMMKERRERLAKQAEAEKALQKQREEKNPPPKKEDEVVVANIKGTEIKSKDPNAKSMQRFLFEREEEKRIKDEMAALRKASENYKKRKGE